MYTFRSSVSGGGGAISLEVSLTLSGCEYRERERFMNEHLNSPQVYLIESGTMMTAKLLLQTAHSSKLGLHGMPVQWQITHSSRNR